MPDNHSVDEIIVEEKQGCGEKTNGNGELENSPGVPVMLQVSVDVCPVHRGPGSIRTLPAAHSKTTRCGISI